MLTQVASLLSFVLLLSCVKPEIEFTHEDQTIPRAYKTEVSGSIQLKLPSKTISLPKENDARYSIDLRLEILNMETGETRVINTGDYENLGEDYTRNKYFLEKLADSSFDMAGAGAFSEYFNFIFGKKEKLVKMSLNSLKIEANHEGRVYSKVIEIPQSLWSLETGAMLLNNKDLGLEIVSTSSGEAPGNTLVSSFRLKGSLILE